ncbi:Arb2 domain-containing protein [Trichoderma aethiopicum]
MAEPQYTVFIRVPIPRRGFVDPPPISWDAAKDEALWKILSGHKEIDFPVDFLVQQVAYLNERHQSHFLAQVRKATAAAKGSATQSPVPASDAGHLRTPSALSIRRDVSTLRNESGAAGPAVNSPNRPAMSRNASGTTTVMRDGSGASPRIGTRPSLRALDQAARTRLSSLPIPSPSPKSPELPAAETNKANSPGPAESSSSSSSDDESLAVQSRIIRRPPRYQPPQDSYPYPVDEDDESEPAFRPYNAPSAGPSSSPDLSSTLKLRNAGPSGGARRNPRPFAKESHHSQTSDSSASSPAMPLRPVKARESNNVDPSSPSRRATDPRSSRDNSEGTPSISSSFSDLDGMSLCLNMLTYHQSTDETAAMFRRLWSGLPEDVTFPSDLKGLGYFVNEDDEIRSIEEPDNYFKFFINRNPRICARQRFAFNHAMEAIIHERLEKEGMQKLRLPQGSSATEPHIPIFITPNLDTKTRIVVIFGEPTQDLGLVAGRVANGPGGIDEGSMVSLVRALASQRSSPDDASPPGIVLANTGQTYWWPEGKRAITVSASAALPLPSLMHKGIREVPSLNGIPGNENPREHVKCVFDQVLGCMAGEKAVVDVVAIGETCEIVEKFLDGQEAWEVLGRRLGSLILLGPVFEADGLTNGEFKDFLAKRARGYLLCSEPAGIPLAPPEGNPELSILPMGFPCVSSSEPSHVETILIQARTHILSHLQDVAMNPGCENPVITLAECLRPALTEQDWVEVPEEEKPVVSKVDPTELKKELKQAKRWKKFAETGVAPDTDTDSESESDV